jgi:hypothetical protein
MQAFHIPGWNTSLSVFQAKGQLLARPNALQFQQDLSNLPLLSIGACELFLLVLSCQVQPSKIHHIVVSAFLVFVAGIGPNKFGEETHENIFPLAKDNTFHERKRQIQVL